MSLFKRMGVRGRLMIAFLAISGFSIIAAGAAFYSFSKAGTVLNQITQQRLPPALASLEISLQAERIIRTAPLLLSADSQEARGAISNEISDRMERLTAQLDDLGGQSADAGNAITIQISPLIIGLEGNLEEVDFFVQQRIDLAERKGALVENLGRTIRDMSRPISGTAESLESDLKRWARQAGGSGDSSSARQAESANNVSELLPVRQAASLLGRIEADALEVADRASPNEVALMESALGVALLELEGLLFQSSDPSVLEQEDRLAELDGMLFAEDGLIALRRDELDVTGKVGELLDQNTEVANQLQAAVNRLVVASKENIRKSSQDAIDVQRLSSAIMIAVVVMSVLSASLITWLYVQRNLIARITGLSESMRAIAGGALRTDIPESRGADEIDQMTDALGVFRDTAIEVEENNLREIAQAQGRLVDALESSSEGFAFFDADDRLELSNARYRELLHGGAAIEPGTSFEDILRKAIDSGSVNAMGLDPDEWLADRLERHREPGEPILQRRGNGQWIMITERRTQNGGAVAVYSDITELKAREAALADERERLATATDRLNLALSMDGIGIWDVDLVQNTVWWSDEYAVMMGHDPESYQPTAESWEEHLHPNSARKTIRAVDKFLEGSESTLRIRQHMKRGDETELHTEALMHVQRDEDGKPIRLTGIDVDITEQREKEDQAKAASFEIAMKNQELESLSSKLSKYLSPQVYESIFSGKQEVKIESARKKLTVFFSDLVGFTETTEKLESEELTQLLNHYLTEMSRVALDHGATIDKYVGDAIVIFFGDPESRGAKEDALACVRMAIAMQQRMQELATGWRDKGFEKPLRCRIGISTAYCTVGNFGSEDRMDYTIIGGGVNLAARLEGAAEPGSILISYETFALIKDEIHCEERGEIEVKGISHPVSTYQVIDQYDRLAQGGEIIVEELPHASINVNVAAMSTKDRQQAADMLKSVVERLNA